MESSKPQPGEVWSRLASGIEAGIVGGAAMLILLVSESMWEGHVWWEFPNLLGSTFYGPRAFRTGVGLATLSGIALHFVITGTVGGLFGLAFGGIPQRGRLVLLGILAAVGWYNLADAGFWPKVNPWVPIGAPKPVTMLSHVLLGACLGYMGQKRKPMPQRAQDPEEPPSDLPAPLEPAQAPEFAASFQTVLAADQRVPTPDLPETPAAGSTDAIE